MSMRRLVPLVAALAVPAVARAQIAEAVPPPAEPPSLAVLLEGSADRPEFAAQRAETRLQNAAETVRQLGTAVARVDTTALGVTRLPEVNGVGAYPPPAYVARYVLRVRLASAADVMTVSTALSRAGAASVLLAAPRDER
jgi:hypothetical protein